MDQTQFNEFDYKLISQKGYVGEFVYRPPNYPGPVALNATVKSNGTSTAGRTAEQTAAEARRKE
jgi:hypothetical protein